MKAVLFDYNGVLVNDLRLHENAYLAVAKAHGYPLSRDRLQKVMHLPARVKIEMLAGTSNPAQVDALLREKEDLFFSMAKDDPYLFPATRDVIESLARVRRLAIITSTTRRQLTALFPPDLREKFKTILTYEDIQKPKPAPDGLIQAMRELAVKNIQSCYIGDSPSDMEAAHRAGVLAIGITTGYYNERQLEAAGADLVVDSLLDLKQAV
ncbi:MAG: HAD family hydrolase [Candidatus Aenigmarchaeota archaeon]|nr:HAD family hydrolase [Candidatus Aenigmarchaeota archaeon]